MFVFDLFDVLSNVLLCARYGLLLLHKFLWELDAGAEKKLTGQEIVNRSAKRVGLFVPETYADREDKKKREAAEKYLADKRAKEAAAATESSA